ncbi:MAG: hypothetical protein JXR26_07325 [Balneolaceae bacterium]|nr:hypothetical protein [Balneolaceae bacterium]
MKHSLVSLLLVFLGYQLSFAQDSTSLNNESPQIRSKEQVQNVVYVEALGNAVGYSLNYEHRLSGKLWGRAGLSYVSGSEGNLITVPLGSSFLFGKQKNFFELGLVVTPAYAEGDFLLGSENEDEEFGIIISPTIGYRYQSKEEVFFKISFTPLLTTFEKTFIPWGGLSVGYSF